jgi:hypothetical protein
MTMEVDVSFSIKVEIVGVGWKYTYLRSLTLFRIENKGDQGYIYKREVEVRQIRVY